MKTLEIGMIMVWEDINMANIIMQARKKLGEGLSMVNDFTSNETVSTILTSEANKLWRAKILLDRVTRKGLKDSNIKIKPSSWSSNQDAGPVRSNLGDEYSKRSPKYQLLSRKSSKNGAINSVSNVRGNLAEVYFPEVWIEPQKEARGKSQKGIIRIYALGKSPAEWIQLQTIPQELDFRTESTWAVINSMGRNTPMYHFTGAETVIQMNISWYCNDPANPQEVVTKCRLLEAWSKANGYTAGPPVLTLEWGGSDLFANSLWILTSATYKLSHWRLPIKVRKIGSRELITPEGYEDPKLYPSMATQELEFRRVSATNLTYEEIVPKDWLSKTKDINI